MGEGKADGGGLQTKLVMEELGWPVHKMASVFNSQGVLKALGSVAGQRIFIPRAQNAPPEFIETLERKGAYVQEVPITERFQVPLRLGG